MTTCFACSFRIEFTIKMSKSGVIFTMGINLFLFICIDKKRTEDNVKQRHFISLFVPRLLNRLENISLCLFVCLFVWSYLCLLFVLLACFCTDTKNLSFHLVYLSLCYICVNQHMSLLI